MKFTQGYKDFEYSQVTFGKYKGYYMRDVPIDYIRWAVKTLDVYKVTPFSVELQRRELEYR